MAADNSRINDYLDLLLENQSVDELKKQLEPDFAKAERRLPRKRHVEPWTLMLQVTTYP